MEERDVVLGKSSDRDPSFRRRRHPHVADEQLGADIEVQTENDESMHVTTPLRRPRVLGLMARWTTRYFLIGRERKGLECRLIALLGGTDLWRREAQTTQG